MLGQDSARAFYGPGHVRAAYELGAIQTLLITDSLFRVNDVTLVSAALGLVLQLLQRCRPGPQLHCPEECVLHTKQLYLVILLHSRQSKLCCET